MPEQDELRTQYRAALDKTIAAYEALIADVEGEKDKWSQYGTVWTCRLCAVNFNEKPTCFECPLSLAGEINMDYGHYPCSGETMHILSDSFDTGTSAEILSAAEDRLEWIRARAISNGYKS